MTRVLRWLRRSVLVLVVTWLLGCGLLAAAIHYTGTVDRAVRSDVIIVLGASLTNQGEPNRALTRRSAHAAELWRDGLAGMIICTGGIGRDLQVARSEADGCRQVLMREGVPRAAILLEETSRNTEENARHAHDIMTAHGWDSAVLVSDSYHVFRARRIFARTGIDVVPSPVPVARIGSPLFYVHSVVREVMALHWQVLN